MIFDEISLSIQQGKAKDARRLIEDALNQNLNPKDILNKGLIRGMSIVGEKFKRNEVFVPEVLIAARAMNQGLEVLKPALVANKIEPIGKAIICTVKGDMHDIGKNLVKMMLEGQGIECIDLGVDVSYETVINAILEHKPQLVCLSALLTTTMLYQQEIIREIEKANLRNNLKIIVGGAPVTIDFANEINADGYRADAASAAELAKELIESL